MVLLKKLMLLIALATLLSACENELDLIEDWKDIPIVYGIVDPSDTAHYFRIERAFVSEDRSGYELAAEIDSVYYKNLDASILNDDTGVSFPLELVDGNLEGYVRTDGLFPQSPNYLYKVMSEDLALKGDEEITLKFKREGIDEVVQSSIRTVGKYNFVRPRPDDPEKINLSYANHLTIRWIRSDNAVAYEVYIIVRYLEANTSDYIFEPKEVLWEAASNVEDNSVMLESKNFYLFMNSALEASPNLVRQFDELEFRVVAIGKELDDYIDIGGANLGITASQEIPQYSNLSEGLGVFSSKWEIALDGLYLAGPTLDSLKYGIYTKDLNFEN